MSIRMKLQCKDGTVGDVVERVCWGFLKINQARDARQCIKHGSLKHYKYYIKGRGLYGHNGSVMTRKEYKAFQEGSIKNMLGITAQQVLTGMSGTTMMLRGSYGRTIIKAKVIMSMMDAYPKLFKQVTNLTNTSVTVSFDGYYAEVYNQLRLLTSIDMAHHAVLEAALANPDLAPMIVNLYPYGGRNSHEASIFKTAEVSKRSLKEFMERRAWRYGRTTDRYNLLHRQHCKKHNKLVFATPTQRVRTGLYFSNGVVGVLPPTLPEFIKLMGGTTCY